MKTGLSQYWSFTERQQHAVLIARPQRYLSPRASRPSPLRVGAPPHCCSTRLFAGAHWLSLLRYVRSIIALAQRAGAHVAPKLLACRQHLLQRLRRDAANCLPNALQLDPPAPKAAQLRSRVDPASPTVADSPTSASQRVPHDGAGLAPLAPLRRSGLWPLGRCWPAALQCQEEEAAQAAGAPCISSSQSVPPAAAAAFPT